MFDMTKKESEGLELNCFEEQGGVETHMVCICSIPLCYLVPKIMECP